MRSLLELLEQREADKESAVAEQEVMVHSGRVSLGEGGWGRGKGVGILNSW